ncbi:MAG: hypothetical protein M1823_005588 [Watsoniomyces obsoletus]|nr:MAG: hypothetical protein M1823_005588 [Watsoniomyces obsoletus]
MAYQTQSGFQTVRPAVSDVWATVSDIARQSLKTRPSRASVAPQPVRAEPAAPRAEAALPSDPSVDVLPDFLKSLSREQLSESLRPPPISGSFQDPTRVLLNQINALSPHRLWQTDSVRTKTANLPTHGRLYSTLLSTLRKPTRWTQGPADLRNRGRRHLFGPSSSRNLLAHMEQTANNNPQSATAQNAFYQALLKADMPNIVAERYSTGRYATNPACDAAYMRALERVGLGGTAKGIGGNGSESGQAGGLSDVQIQAIAQAVAAQARGGTVAISRDTGTSNLGGKEKPIYVVARDTVGGVLFKIGRTLVYLGLGVYFSLMIITMLIENTGGSMRRIGASQNNEAQARHQTVKFSDVHGCEEAKDELQELVEFLKSPDKFSALGGKMPKGVLLVGPPGTGKTLLARAVAGEAGVPFFFMSGSEFDEVFVGVGAKRIRDLFTAARGKSPSIIFIDELDAIGGRRNERDGAYAKQTLNQLLTELDGFSQSSGVIVLAATNFPQLLDKALTRPGRFDRHVVVPLPDVRGRVAILKHHMKSVQIGTDVDAAVIARGTPGFSGAELENVVNQAAVHASRNKAKKVTMHDFEWAKDKIMMGAERRSAVIQEKDKLMTAYHEGGHTLVALFTEGSDTLYKATIMPRGQALGITFQLPEIDKVSQTKAEMLAQIDICMGGKVAEELVYGPDNVTSGASSDIEKATNIAYAMVTQLGMSEKLGNVNLDKEYQRLSAETRMQVDREVRRLIEEGRIRATKILTERRKDLDVLAKALVEYETLNKEEIERVLKGEKLPEKLTSAPSVPIKLPESLMLPGFSGDAPEAEDAAIEAGPADGPTADEPSVPPAGNSGEASST